VQEFRCADFCPCHSRRAWLRMPQPQRCRRPHLPARQPDHRLQRRLLGARSDHLAEEGLIRRQTRALAAATREELGQSIAGTTKDGGGIEWSFGRKRGLDCGLQRCAGMEPHSLSPAERTPSRMLEGRRWPITVCRRHAAHMRKHPPSPALFHAATSYYRTSDGVPFPRRSP